MRCDDTLLSWTPPQPVASEPLDCCCWPPVGSRRWVALFVPAPRNPSSWLTCDATLFSGRRQLAGRRAMENMGRPSITRPEGRRKGGGEAAEEDEAAAGRRNERGGRLLTRCPARLVRAMVVACSVWPFFLLIPPRSFFPRVREQLLGPSPFLSCLRQEPTPGAHSPSLASPVARVHRGQSYPGGLCLLRSIMPSTNPPGTGKPLDKDTWATVHVQGRGIDRYLGTFPDRQPLRCHALGQSHGLEAQHGGRKPDEPACGLPSRCDWLGGIGQADAYIAFLGPYNVDCRLHACRAPVVACTKHSGDDCPCVTM